MKRIVAIFKVLEDALMESSECDTFADAINQEMGWLHDSGILCESWQEAQDSPAADLEKYRKCYGNIVFPDSPEEGQSEVRRDIYANPAGWMYSMDGLHWEEAPMDIGKIDYRNAMFRRIPTGVIVGASKAVRDNPQEYNFSTNNGYTWHPLCSDKSDTYHHWIYHGAHKSVWFQKKQK